ncbi:MAG TPA: hypothetical protein VK826_14015 [Bacteroidia bacterium]|nr:hypothetical protein [Bacteroidia bacterium]
MHWNKKGLVFGPSKGTDWLQSHAQVPTALVKADEGILRVYFATRPEPGRSMTSFVDLDLNDLSRVKYVHNDFILPVGRPGTFDQHGIMPSSVVEHEGQVYLYYSGWSRSAGVPYNNFTGLAISSDGGKTFVKHTEAPVLERNSRELFSATSPNVLREGGHWHMWYCSGTNWHEVNGKFEHTYDIKYASSADGKKWIQNGLPVIRQKNEFEAITKPAVIRMNGTYHMWYCYRGSEDFRNGKQSYRIGYAQSKDATNWERMDDQSGIDVSASGWDSMMIAYPEIVRINDRMIMLYNGNHFGMEGFGYAELIY